LYFQFFSNIYIFSLVWSSAAFTYWLTSHIFCVLFISCICCPKFTSIYRRWLRRNCVKLLPCLFPCVSR
jgi:hypothetical protein